jgi:CRISPR-associated protein Cas2
MRLLVMFDLPVTTPKERRAASRFRQFLLKDGYYMMQFSVYIRICNGKENADAHLARLKCQLPEKGSVRSLFITEKQYESMQILCGSGHTDFDRNAEETPVLAF